MRYNTLAIHNIISDLEDLTMKKVLALILAVLMIATLFVACDSDDKKDDNKGDAKKTTVATTTEAPDEENKPVLKMGTNAEFPPYEYYENDKIVGIDAEIAKAIADKLGMKLEIVDMKFDSILTSVQSGGVDMGVAGLTITDERLESVNFSVSYATGVQVVIVKEGSGITSLDDLAGKKIGVQLATTGDIYASDEFGDENVVKYNKGADAVQALVGGGIDAVIIDNEPAKSFVSNNDGLVILETEYAVEEYAIAVDKSNTELLKKINKAIEELIEDGTIDAIMDKYIKAE